MSFCTNAMQMTKFAFIRFGYAFPMYHHHFQFNSLQKDRFDNKFFNGLLNNYSNLNKFQLEKMTNEYYCQMFAAVNLNFLKQ